ncbi:MAG: c-type cytochrome biogenesis protein CcsB [bacterium]|nr:c-type cytochrome biogenesis protein CcsB [bacterium]
MHWELVYLLAVLPIYLIGAGLSIVQRIPRPSQTLSETPATIFRLLRYARNDKRAYPRLLPQGILIAGLALHTLAILIRGFRGGYIPITNIYESLVFFSWAIILFSILISIRKQITILHLFVVPFAIIILMVGLFSLKDIQSLNPALQSYWMIVHTGFGFFSYAAYTLACAIGLMYLFLEKEIKRKKFGFFYRTLPPLETLDALNYFAVTIGFFLLTLCIITGALWAKDAWGRYWAWDPKETWSLATWLLYAIVLHIRYTATFRGRKVAYLSILGFGFIIFTFLGIGLLLPQLKSLHAYL